jgi:hypothetical protein
MKAVTHHRITVIEGVGHAVVYEAAREVAALLIGGGGVR